MNTKAKKPDLRPPEHPADRVLALETVMDAKGLKLPAPPRCLGYVNCCRCPVCQLREERRRPALAA
jgi:hypothetical protein